MRKLRQRYIRRQLREVAIAEKECPDEFEKCWHRRHRAEKTED